jgi:Domain of unknown function (DUF4338)
MIDLIPIKRTYPKLLENMRNHYSQPKGFVGRNICYAVVHDMNYFGAIVGGSTPKHLAGRDYAVPLNSIVNNIFFHVEGPYPVRNFVQRTLAIYRKKIELDWFLKFGDFVEYHETLVELPRNGECYRRDDWRRIGQTKGFTCKRTGGKGTDSWTGKRVWNTENLRPKLVFSRKVDHEGSQ